MIMAVDLSLDKFSLAAQLALFLLNEGRFCVYSKPTSHIQELFDVSFILIQEDRSIILTEAGKKFAISIFQKGKL